MSLIKLKNNALDNLTSFEGSASLGDMVFISSATASSSTSIEFTLGDYKEYKFFFVNIHPSVDAARWTFQASTDNGSSYGVTITSTAFAAYHGENDTFNGLGYTTAQDLAQSTSFKQLVREVGSDNDQNTSGILQIFNPASSVYVKHFISRFSDIQENDAARDDFTAGYFNSVSPLTNIKFQFSSGNIDDGKILMFGLN